MSSVVPFPVQAHDANGPLPEGEYTLAYTGHELKFMFNTGKLFVRFRIADGEHTGAQLYRAYNVKMTGKRSFKVSPTSALYREFCTVSGRRERLDRISIARLRNVLIRGKVRTVARDAKQRPLAPYLQYSVVSALLSLEAGSMP